MKKIIVIVICFFLSLTCLAYSNQKTPISSTTTANMHTDISKGQITQVESMAKYRGFWYEVRNEIITQPINLGILILGIITLLLSFTCWRSSSKKKTDLVKQIKQFESENVNPVFDASMECLAGIQMTPYLQRFSKFSNLINNIYNGTSIQQDKNNFSNNLYFALVDILPLCGISGTLFAIAKQAYSSSGLNVVELKATLGLAIISTLVALIFTIISKGFEAVWIDNIEYVKDNREIFTLYQMNMNGSDKIVAALDKEKK